MKRVLCSLVPIFALVVATGCDELGLPSDAKTILEAQGINAATTGDLLQTQQHLRLMDGSCVGDGNQYQHGGPGGSGVNGAGGQGNGRQARLRDGSCGGEPQ